MNINKRIETLRAEINDLIQEAFRERMQNKPTKRFRAICKRIDELEGELVYFEDLKKNCLVPIVKGFVAEDLSDESKNGNVDAFEEEEQCQTES